MSETMRTLIIMRHGHAQALSNEGDMACALKDKGKRNAQRVGVFLAQNGFDLSHAVTSPAERALVSAEKAMKAGGFGIQKLRTDKRLYEGGAEEVLQAICETPKNIETLLVVAHKPALIKLLKRLSPAGLPKNRKGKILPKAAAMVFDLAGVWSELSYEKCRFRQVVYPATLPRLFPFPGIMGQEERIRPSYYYSQSCVIPYRKTEDGLEVLVITSSKNKHWVLPKGIHEPGLTAQQSASEEALEEAGVSGRVHKRMVGSYDYDKWEGTCTVGVYALEVRDVQGQADWAENHRKRQWCSISDAAKLVSNPDLAAIILKLTDFLEQETS